MSADLSDTLAERLRAAARLLPALPADVMEALRGALADPVTDAEDAA